MGLNTPSSFVLAPHAPLLQVVQLRTFPALDPFLKESVYNDQVLGRLGREGFCLVQSLTCPFVVKADPYSLPI